jgi:zinc D-Ala-D-Ala carboxypeptidase
LIEVLILRKTHSAGEEFGSRSNDDIPIAHRDRFVPDVTTLTSLRRQRKTLTKGLYFAGGIALTAVALAVGAFLFRNASISSTPAAISVAPTAVARTEDSLLGHLSYDEAPASTLQTIDGGLKLRSTAAQQFKAMIAAAKAAGIKIKTISAFRSVADQEKIFFEIKAQRKQDANKRAEVSAPPKHSEHHTGYAVDIGDATNSALDLKPEFETTAAFKWLQANAARYSFELSFPKDNTQGVSYEPWHWRYVGDSDSLETFYRAKKIQSVSNPQP